MPRLTELAPRFVETIPRPPEMEEGVLYISEKFGTAIHLCACGCKEQTVTPINHKLDDGTMTTYGWDYTWVATASVSVTLRPSIGNQNFPCKSHYWITNNKVEWC